MGWPVICTEVHGCWGNDGLRRMGKKENVSWIANRKKKSGTFSVELFPVYFVYPPTFTGNGPFFLLSTVIKRMPLSSHVQRRFAAFSYFEFFEVVCSLWHNMFRRQDSASHGTCVSGIFAHRHNAGRIYKYPLQTRPTNSGERRHLGKDFFVGFHACSELVCWGLRNLPISRFF